jgi:hypothetical protein
VVRPYQAYTTPQERIAAVIRNLIDEMNTSSSGNTENIPSVPDFADIRDRVAPYIELEIAVAKLNQTVNLMNEEAERKGKRLYLIAKATELKTEIAHLKSKISEIEQESQDKN